MIEKIKYYWNLAVEFSRKYCDWIIAILVLLLILSWCSGCATSKDLDKNYLAYLEAMKTQPKILEIVAQPGQTVELKGIEKFVVYGAIGIQIEQYHAPLSTTSFVAKEMFGFLRYAAPYGFGFGVADRMFHTLDKSIANAGHNTTISGSYNTDRHDVIDYSGSVNDSYNPKDSYNDRHDVNDSYKPIDSRQNYENDYRQNYENPVTNSGGE